MKKTALAEGNGCCNPTGSNGSKARVENSYARSKYVYGLI